MYYYLKTLEGHRIQGVIYVNALVFVRFFAIYILLLCQCSWICQSTLSPNQKIQKIYRFKLSNYLTNIVTTKKWKHGRK